MAVTAAAESVTGESADQVRTSAVYGISSRWRCPPDPPRATRVAVTYEGPIPSPMNRTALDRGGALTVEAPAGAAPAAAARAAAKSGSDRTAMRATTAMSGTIKERNAIRAGRENGRRRNGRREGVRREAGGPVR